jgi:hypothetical protein
VKRVFFLCCADFAMAFLDLICLQYLNKDEDHGKDMLGRAILKLKLQGNFVSTDYEFSFSIFTSLITNNNFGLNIVPC